MQLGTEESDKKMFITMTLSYKNINKLTQTNKRYVHNPNHSPVYNAHENIFHLNVEASPYCLKNTCLHLHILTVNLYEINKKRSAEQYP